MAEKHTLGKRRSTGGNGSLVAGGANTGSGIGNEASGTNSIAVGDNCTASDDNTFAGGTGSTASGANAIAYGNTAAASGDNAAAFCSGSSATGTNSFAVSNGTASGIGSQSLGNSCDSSADYSQSSGRSSSSDHYAEWSRASNSNAQYGMLSFIRRTTNDTPAEMFLDGSTGATGSLRFTITAGNSYTVRVSITAVIETSGDTSSWYGTGVVKNVGGTTSDLAGITMNVVDQDAGLATASVTAAADNTNDSLKIEVTGIATTNIRWICRIDYEKITFA